MNNEEPITSLELVGGISGPSPTHILTHTGTHLDLTDPSADEIHAEDIAHGLALTCRYGGQTRRFYSVAEHSVLTYDLARHLGLEPEAALAVLLHDAPEAYLGDIVTPLKHAMRPENGRSPYDHANDLLEVAIGKRFDIAPSAFSSPDVKRVDIWALKIEAERLTNQAGGGWRFPQDLPNDGQLPGDISFHSGLNWSNAKELFLERLANVIGWPAVWI